MSVNMVLLGDLPDQNTVIFDETIFLKLILKKIILRKYFGQSLK